MLGDSLCMKLPTKVCCQIRPNLVRAEEVEADLNGETIARWFLQHNGLVVARILELTWVLVKGSCSSYYHKETILFTIDPYYGNLKKLLITRAQLPVTFGAHQEMVVRPDPLTFPIFNPACTWKQPSNFMLLLKVGYDFLGSC